MNQPTCYWKTYEDYGLWHTDCGKEFHLLDGTPEENNMKFCCFCGGELKNEYTPRP